VTEKTKPGIFVTKIIVKQGDPSKLYSISNNFLECYIRNDGESVFLKADETYKRIVDRAQKPD